MAHVVVVDNPPTMAQTDGTPVAATPGAVEMTTASTPNDDLESLRQRLATEQPKLPNVRVNSRPPRRKSKVIPLLHSEF